MRLHTDIQMLSEPMLDQCISRESFHLGKEVLEGTDTSINFKDYLASPHDSEIMADRRWL